MGSSQKIANGFLWTVVFNIVNVVYGFISVPILLSYFGKSQYGLIGLAISINVYMQLMDMGLGSTSLRFFSAWRAQEDIENVKKSFQTSFAVYTIIGIINAFVLFLISLFSINIFNVTPDQNIILKDLIKILMISAFLEWISSCFDQLIRSTENVAWIQKRSLLPKLFQILILIITIAFKLNIIMYFALTTFSIILILPMSLKKIRKEFPYLNYIPKIYKDIFIAIKSYSLNLFSFSIFQFSFYNLRTVFLGMRGSADSVADFNIMGGIATAVTMFGGAFLGTLLPSTSKVMALHNKDAYYRVAYDGTKYISIILSFCCFGMITVLPDVLSIYVGEKYLYLVPWIYLWLLCTLGNHNQAISSLILGGTDVRAVSYSSAFASVIGLAASWFLIPYYNAGAAVIGFALYMLVQIVFYYIYYWPKQMKINSKKVFTYCFIQYVFYGLIGCMICRQLPHFSNHWVNVLYLGGIFALLYIILSWFTLPKNNREYLKILIKKIK